MDLEIGQLLNGKYRIARRIGQGGMASVYEARHVGLGTPVAVKVLLPELARAPTIADRFRREARVSATLESAHVIDVTDVDQLPDGRPYLVMELLRGRSLEDVLLAEKPLGRERAVDIGLQMLLGLECAHALGVVHRDLKPGNVFLAERPAAEQRDGPIVKLLDFGIAKVRASTEFQALTRPGMVMGTPEYMAPEQAYSADQASTRSDLYSVGVMLYEMLSGELPARGDVPLIVAQQVITGQVKPLRELCPGLPDGLLNLVQRTLEPNPLARPESALELRRALSAYAGQLSLAGRAAAHTPPRERAAPVVHGPSRTEKVPAQLAPPTAEMSQFQAPHRPSGTAPIVAVGDVARASPVAPPALGTSAAPAPRASGPGAPHAARGLQVTVSLSQPSPAATGSSAAPGAPHGGPVLAPTLPTPPPPPDISYTRRRRSALLWLTLCGVLLGAAVGIVWLLQVSSDPGPPPPLPRLKLLPAPMAAPAPRP
jgi:serine/threonine protein kinase